MGGLLLHLLQHALPGGSVLERELGQNAAELVGLCVLDAAGRGAEPQQELDVAVHHSAVHGAQHHDSLRAVGQELRHSAQI